MPSAPKTKWEEASDEIMTHVVELAYEKAKMARYAIRPTHVILPSRLNVPYEGDDATDLEARMFGLPVLWVDEEQWGFAVTLLLPKERG